MKTLSNFIKQSARKKGVEFTDTSINTMSNPYEPEISLEEEVDYDRHFSRQSKEVQTKINHHLRQGADYPTAARKAGATAIRVNKLAEAVEVSTTEYEYSHGRKPRGSAGGWMFGKHKSVNFDKHEEGKDYVTIKGVHTYGEAKKKAKEWAASKGHRIIHALPESTNGTKQMKTLNQLMTEARELEQDLIEQQEVVGGITNAQIFDAIAEAVGDREVTEEELQAAYVAIVESLEQQHAEMLEEQTLDEEHDIELKPHPKKPGTHYVVHKINDKSIDSDQLKTGETLNDTHVDDLKDMGYKVKIHKS